MISKFDIPVYRNNEPVSGIQVVVLIDEEQHKVEVVITGEVEFATIRNHVWGALQDVRVVLECEGCLLGCIGVLENTFSSGMAASYHMGRLVYQMIIGEGVYLRESLAPVGQYEIDQLATIAQQAEFYLTQVKSGINNDLELILD